MDYLSEKFDLAITNVGTDGSGTALVGMMLVRKAGVPSWNAYDGKALADQFYSDAPSQEFTDPEEEILLSQGPDWRAGFGKTYFDAADTKRYHSSIGADLRYPIGAILGPVASSACIKPTKIPPMFRDLGFETWTSATALTYWTKTSGTVNQESATIHSETYSAELVSGGGTASIITHPVANWSTDYQGGVFAFAAYVKSGTAGVARIGISDGASTVWSGNHNGDNQWQQLNSGTITVAATATTLQILCNTQSGGGGYTSWFDTGSISGSATILAASLSTTVALAEFNDNLYASFGKALGRLDAGGSTFVGVQVLGNNITDLEPFTDSQLYIACGTGGTYSYANTAEFLTASTAAVAGFQYLKVVHAAVPTMWGNSGVNVLRSNADPSGSAWSGTTTVGSSYHNITSLIQKSGALYIGKEDMVYYLDGSGNVQNDLAPELTAAASATSAKNMKLWKNNIYIPAGAQALLRTDGATNEFIQPGNFISDLSDFAGQVQAVAYDEEYLFIAVDNGTKVEILAGRDETVDGSTSWRWHPIAELTLTGVETMFVSTVYQKRLWITSTVATEPIYYIPLPVTYGNVTTDANRTFKTGGYFTTPFLHGGFKNNKKAYMKLTVTLGHSYDADIWWTASYKKLADTAWTLIIDALHPSGHLVGEASDRTAIIYLPDDASSGKPVSTMMELKFTGGTDDTTKTPILIQYTLTAVLYPNLKNIYYAQVLCAQDIQTRIGTVEKNAQSTIIATLDNARSATWPVSIRDIAGSTRAVKFLPVPKDVPRYTVKRDEKGREIERVYNLYMLEVPTAPNLIDI